MVTGANNDGVHLRGVDIARDISVGKWADLREVLAGEPCPVCGQPLDVLRAIETGHIFKLGTRYTEVLGVSVLGADGQRITPVMGCYGIGVERAMAAIVETHNDADGIVWPVAVAPFEVAIVLLNSDDEPTRQAAENLYGQLLSDGIDVILDDRDLRPGAKFKDVELIGIPFRVTVGKRGLATGMVEITTRATGDTVAVAVADAGGELRKLVAAGAARLADQCTGTNVYRSERRR
jgi:prolyl-tRNA synthetase